MPRDQSNPRQHVSGVGYCYSNRVPFQSVPYLISRTKSPKTVSVNLMSRVKSQGASGSNQASHAIGFDLVLVRTYWLG